MSMPTTRQGFPPVVVLIFVGLCSLLGVALVQGTADAQDAEFTIKFGTVAPAGTPWSEQLEAIKARVEKDSGGRIKFKLYLGGTLGGEVEMVRSLRRNRIQGWGGSTAALAEGAGLDAFQVFELPFMFNSEAEVDYVMDEHLYEPMAKLLAENGFEMAYWHVNGWHNFATKGKPIHTPEDLQGLKMRSQESPVHLAMFKALGAQAISMPVPEVLGALQTNMVMGFSNTPLFTAATGWYEGIDHYTITHHIYQPAIIIYNKEFYDSLPEDMQRVLIGDRAYETKYGRDSVRNMTPELLDLFRSSGITIYEMTPEERQVFQDLCKDVPDQFHDTIGRTTINTVQAAVKLYRASH